MYGVEFDAYPTILYETYYFLLPLDSSQSGSSVMQTTLGEGSLELAMSELRVMLLSRNTDFGEDF